MSLSARVLPAVALALFVACGEPRADLLATWDGGEIDRQELDAFVTSLPLERRSPQEGDFRRWHEELIRELATREILLAEAHRRGIPETPDFRQRLTEVRKRAIVDHYLRRELKDAGDPITREDLAAYLEAHRSRFESPERRLVYHLFLRIEPGESRERAEREAMALRQRVLDGESFAEVAARHSDSELRHRRGLMGWIDRGAVPAALEEVIFALPERQPSRPLTTPDGVHLFWVETALARQTIDLDDAPGALAVALHRERLAEAADALIEIALPEGSFVPDQGELAVLLARGDPGALVLRVADYELRLAELRELIESAAADRTVQQVDASQVVAGVVRRERLYLQAVAEGLADDPELAPTLEALRSAELYRHYRYLRLEEFADSREALLREHYANRRGRYTTPLRLRLRSLTVPIPDSAEANRLLARLESAASRIEAGTTLEELADETGGRIEEVGWLAAPQLAAFGHVGSLVASSLSGGEVSAPFRTGMTVRVLEALEREEPAPLPWEAARERVLEDLLAERGTGLYRELQAALLEEHDFSLVESALEGLGGDAADAEAH